MVSFLKERGPNRKEGGEGEQREQKPRRQNEGGHREKKFHNKEEHQLTEEEMKAQAAAAGINFGSERPTFKKQVKAVVETPVEESKQVIESSHESKPQKQVEQGKGRGARPDYREKDQQHEGGRGGRGGRGGKQSYQGEGKSDYRPATKGQEA